MRLIDEIAGGWLIFSSAVAFIAFGFDKWRATGARDRVRESTLALLGAIGGWPGGLLGMILFRHKTAKLSFKFKYALALVPFVGEVWGWWRWR